MNAKLRAFTNRAAILAAAALAMGVQTLSAQTSYDMIQDKNFWNDGRNISGIRGGEHVKASFAEISGHFVSGDFKPSYEASSFYKAGAESGPGEVLDDRLVLLLPKAGQRHVRLNVHESWLLSDRRP